MKATDALAKNLTFWHWYPRVLVPDLSPEQLRWQPASHDTSVAFALWHAYRSTDEICHGLVMGGRPSVFRTGNWAERLPVAETGTSGFGNGLSREQIGRISLTAEALCDYATAVGAGLVSYLRSASDDELAAEVSLPFFRDVYEGVDTMTRLEALVFFALGHTAEHLGEVQMVRGLMGLKGAPL
jgi:hypothetical protein